MTGNEPGLEEAQPDVKTQPGQGFVGRVEWTQGTQNVDTDQAGSQGETPGGGNDIRRRITIQHPGRLDEI